MNTWYTADLHLNHPNIIEYCNRPFKSVTHMDMEIIRRWNERVKSDDRVIIVGDVCFCKKDKSFTYYMEQLNGEKIIILGNHDKNNGVNTVIQSMVIRHGGHDFWVAHHPVKKYTYNLCGHVHDHWKVWKSDKVVVNVGVDVWDFRPISIHDILKAISKAGNGYTT